MTKGHNEERYARIISGALMHFYFSKGIRNITLNICILEDCLTVYAQSRMELTEAELAELEILKKPLRLPEFEEYYDSLAGIGDGSSELSNLDTLSSMVDETLIKYTEDKLLKIELTRRF